MLAPAQFNVTDVAVRVLIPGEEAPGPNRVLGRSQAIIRNNGGATAYLGLETVTVGNGFPLPAGSTISIAPFGKTDVLWARCATGQSTDIRVLRQDHVL